MIRGLLMRKTQNYLRKELNKITPTRSCEIRILTKLTEKQNSKAKVVTVPKEAKKTFTKPKVVVEKKEEAPVKVE